MRSCRGYFDEIAQPIVFKLTIKCTYMDTPIRIKVLKYPSDWLLCRLHLILIYFRLHLNCHALNQVDETSALIQCPKIPFQSSLKGEKWKTHFKNTESRESIWMNLIHKIIHYFCVFTVQCNSMHSKMNLFWLFIFC